MNDLEKRIEILETLISQQGSQQLRDKNAMLNADWQRADMAFRLRELELAVGNDMEIGEMDKPDPEDPYYGEPSGSSFSGTAYVSGLKITGLNSNPLYPWVKIDLSAMTAVEDAGPPPNPFPPSIEYYEKSKTVGDIHVTRL